MMQQLQWQQRAMGMAWLVVCVCWASCCHAQESQVQPTQRGEVQADHIASVSYDFQSDDQAKAFAQTAEGEGMRKGSEPRIEDGRLALLDPWWKFTTSAGFVSPTTRLVRTIEVSFAMTMSKGTEGMGFAWLDTTLFGSDGKAPPVKAWEVPNIEGSFGIGFDAKDPVNYDMFRGSGNIYDRPEHEISLHWDGREIVKKLCPVEFRDEQPHIIHATITFVTGGSEITLRVDDAVVFDNYFLPSMTAYIGRPAFGGHNSDTAGQVTIDDLAIVCDQAIESPAPPTTIVALDHVLNDRAHPTNSSQVAFPDDLSPYGRIIMSLSLDKPETRFDPWDRSAFVYVYDNDGTRYELLRYITPYHKGHFWQVDVSDFRPLLSGTRTIEQVCSTQGEGWVVSVRFDLYPGPADRYATKVVKLWEGKCVIGNPDKPTSEFYTPYEVEVPDDATSAAIRMVVTGHGMSPNTDNAAEFMPIGRTLTIHAGEQTLSEHNTLWKTDNYLNPCRPQGGTWKFDRAGWGPGDVVRPWKVELSPALLNAARIGDTPSDTAKPEESDADSALDAEAVNATPSVKPTLTIDYVLDDYINENRGKTWEPFHLTEGHVIFYRLP